MQPANVSVSYYVCPSHSELRVDNVVYSVGNSSRYAGINDKTYDFVIGRAKNDGAPFIQFQLSVDPNDANAMTQFLQKIVSAEKDAYENSDNDKLKSIREIYDTRKTTCMGFVSDQLEQHAHISLPYPASLSPPAAAVCLFSKYLWGQLPFTKKEVTGIDMVGKFKATPERVCTVALAGLETAILIPPSIITSIYKNSVQKIANTVTSSIETVGLAALSLARMSMGH